MDTNFANGAILIESEVLRCADEGLVLYSRYRNVPYTG